MKNVSIQYYVEGENEKKLVSIFKSDLRYIKPGKVQILNVLQNYITDAHIRTLKKGTIVVLVFDTDTGQANILNQNIKKLKESSCVSKVITVPQVPNLEGELVRSCSIKSALELLNSKSKKDFKSEFIHITNLDVKLKEHNFKLTKFWDTQPGKPYHHLKNDADEIKIYPNARKKDTSRK